MLKILTFQDAMNWLIEKNLAKKYLSLKVKRKVKGTSPQRNLLVHVKQRVVPLLLTDAQNNMLRILMA